MRYDMIVIGGGSAGLTAAIIAARAGVRVALVEKARIGGDCTWYGCVPSKALIHAARTLRTAHAAAEFTTGSVAGAVSWEAVRAHIDRARALLYAPESPDMLRAQGVAVIEGAARFLDPHTIHVNGETLRAKRFVIAAGGRAVIPSISGLADVPYLTNETVFELDRLPQRLAVIGAGYMGVELASAFQQLGVQVTLMGGALLPQVDAEARAVITRVLARDGVQHIAADASAIAREGDAITITAGDHTIRADQVLVAAGRAPNIHDLDLANAGVNFSDGGIRVNQHLQTSVRHIYAAGDCTGGFYHTHYAGFQGSTAAINALLPVYNQKGLRQHVVSAMFTTPELAQAGLTEDQARAQYGDRIRVMTMPLHEADRAVTDEDHDGFIKLMYTPRGKIIGATIVAARAGEMIIEYALGIERGLSATTLAGVIHPYPTYGSASSRLFSEVLSQSLLTGMLGRLIKTLVRFNMRMMSLSA